MHVEALADDGVGEVLHVEAARARLGGVEDEEEEEEEAEEEAEEGEEARRAEKGGGAGRGD